MRRLAVDCLLGLVCLGVFLIHEEGRAATALDLKLGERMYVESWPAAMGGMMRGGGMMCRMMGR